MLLPSTIENDGAASARTAEAATADTHGRRITSRTQRVQNRDWDDSGRRVQCSRDDLRSGRTPEGGQYGGISVAEVNTATATARIAPVAIDRRTGVLIR